MSDENIAKIVKKFPKVFEGVGKLKNKQIELVIDQEVQPVAQQQRRIPFHLRDKVEKQLRQLEQQDIIERVPEDEKTDWVSPIVCVPKKNDEIRIYVDMRAANRAIKRVRHPIPTVDDVALDLNGAEVFSKLDLSEAFHQLELSPASRNIFFIHVIKILQYILRSTQLTRITLRYYWDKNPRGARGCVYPKGINIDKRKKTT